MNKTPSGTVRLITLAMVGIALIFGGCSFWDHFGHPGQGIRVDICVSLGKYIKVANVGGLLEALNHFSPDGSLYRITVRTKPDGSGDKTYGKLSSECCAEKRPRKLQLYSVTVTQTYKFQAGAQSEEALKQVVKELEKKSG